MDIQMPCMNGMEAAYRLRALDEQVVLVFVTNLTQYAIEGYAVNAQDYIAKPFNYYEFALKFKRTLSRVPHRETPSLLVRSDGQTIRLELRDLHYVEVQGHLLLYHTATQTYRQFGSLGGAGKADCTLSFCALQQLLSGELALCPKRLWLHGGTDKR